MGCRRPRPRSRHRTPSLESFALRIPKAPAETDERRHFPGERPIAAVQVQHSRPRRRRPTFLRAVISTHSLGASLHAGVPVDSEDGQAAVRPASRAHMAARSPPSAFVGDRADAGFGGKLLLRLKALADLADRREGANSWPSRRCPSASTLDLQTHIHTLPQSTRKNRPVF